MITYYKLLDASAIAMSSNYKLDNQHWLMQSTLRAFRAHKRYIGKLLSQDIAQYCTTNLLAARHTLTGNQQIYMHSAYENAQNQLLLAGILNVFNLPQSLSPFFYFQLCYLMVEITRFSFKKSITTHTVVSSICFTIPLTHR